jgi:hypothetical protein
MAENEDRKAELIAQLAHARDRIENSGGNVRHALDVPARMRSSFRRHGFAWAGGAILVGILIAKLPRRTRKVYVNHQGEPIKAAGKAGLLLAGGKIAFDLLRPALTKWATHRATPYMEKWASKYTQR